MLAEKANMLSLLHQLEGVSSGSTIGPLAESLLEELQEAGASPVGRAIKKLRAATKAAMKQKAMARRKAMLASLNMPSTVSLGVPDALRHLSSWHCRQALQWQLALFTQSDVVLPLHSMLAFHGRF